MQNHIVAPSRKLSGGVRRLTVGLATAIIQCSLWWSRLPSECDRSHRCRKQRIIGPRIQATSSGKHPSTIIEATTAAPSRGKEGWRGPPAARGGTPCKARGKRRLSAIQPWPSWHKAIPSSEQRNSFAASAESLSPVQRVWESILGSLVFGDRHFEPSRTDVDDLHQRRWLPGAKRSALRSACVRLSRRRRNLRDFVTLLAESHHTNRPLEKYPFHYLVMPELIGALPEARFIFMSRWRIGVYRSLLRRTRIEIALPQPLGATSWMTMASPAFAYDWNRSVYQ
jgi:hypothetical protein